MVVFYLLNVYAFIDPQYLYYNLDND